MFIQRLIYRSTQIKFLLSKRFLFSKGATQSTVVIDKNAYVLLVVPIATFFLGSWQIKRWKWKLNLIDDLEKKMLIADINLPNDLDTLLGMEYQKVRVKGTFDHSKEVYIGPRTFISREKESDSGVFSKTPKSGYHVITPFHLNDRDMVILVNRGWVQKQQVLPDKRLDGQVEGEVELVGVVRQTEKKTAFSPKTKSSGNFFLFRDLEAISEKCGTAPVFLDADFQSSVPYGPIGGQTRVVLRNEHVSYIITWYSLTAATLWLWYRKFIHYAKL